MEELIPKITEAVDIRLAELNVHLQQISGDIKSQTEVFIDTFNKNTSDITARLAEMKP